MSTGVKGLRDGLAANEQLRWFGTNKIMATSWAQTGDVRTNSLCSLQFCAVRSLSSISNLCQTVLTVPIPIPFKSFRSITVSFYITTIHTIKTKGNACNAHSMRIWVFTLGCALASMRIQIRIDETTLGGDFDAHSPRRSSFACNYMLQLAHYCITSFSGSKKIGSTEQTKQRTKASFVPSKQLTQSTTT